jgi:sugar phosphate isomerase/epimerase
MSMQGFGFKVVDRDADAIGPVIEQALTMGRPIEVGLYFDDAPAVALMDRLLGSADIPVNTHLDHSRLNVLGFERSRDGFAPAIERSQRLGARYSVTHLADYPLSPRASMREELLATIERHMAALDALCGALDHAIHIENTFHELALYREVFARVTERGLGRIHFCFDIGHAKVWSNDTLGDWVAFLLELRERGIRLHFHLHQNHGLSDEHLSFVEVDASGLNRADAYTGGRPYLEWIARLAELFPESRKVFEVDANLAVANLDFVMDQLGRIEPGVGDVVGLA